MKNFSDIFALAFIVLAATLLLPAAEVHAFPANQCAAERFGSDLNCTANDVQITGMSIVGDTASCVGGEDVTLDLQMTINFGSPSRYDVGIFIPNDGNSPQFLPGSGGAASCSVSALPPSSPFMDLNSNACGDGENNLSGIHYMSNVTVSCQSLAGAGGNLFIPYVVSWNHKSNGSCSSGLDVVPSGKSKCNAPTVVQGSVAVVVLPTISKTDGIDTLFDGDSTSYTVTITNTTGAVLSGAVFRDPAVAGIAVSSLNCVAAGGATCPGGITVGQMQGAGITIPDMPVGGSVTFTIGATLTGNPGDTRSNTASVTVGDQTNTAIDTNTIVDTIAILPTSQSKNGTVGSMVNYTYTLYNFGASADTISLSANSGSGWTTAVSPTSVSVPAGGSTAVTLTVTVPGGASVGDVDSTTVTAVSGNFPSKTATATAVTTVTETLTLVPSNTGSGGAGSSVYYSHRVQSNKSSTGNVSLSPSFTGGTCTGWTSALFETDKTTPLTLPVTLAPNGGYRDFVLEVSIPAGTPTAATCTATLTAEYTSAPLNTVSVTDVTTVKNLVLYEDPGFTDEQYIYPAGNNVYAKGFGLDSSTNYEYRWYDSNGTEVCTPRATSTTGTTFPDTCSIPAAGPLGTWTARIWNLDTNTSFVESFFYVGPDHLEASYSGVDPAPTSSNVVIDLALHDRPNHVVPFDPMGNLVRGDPADPEGPLMITVTVSGSASIVSTTLTGAVISGQSVTGKLDSTTGTATLTITNSIAETVTITPVSYNELLYGSPVRDEPVTVTFEVAGAGHFDINHDGQAVNCQAEPITIEAHLDDHTIDTSYTGTLNLSTSTGNGDWTVITGSGSLNNGAANDGAATYTMVAGDNGVVVLGLKDTTVETVNINVTDGSISETTGSAMTSEDNDLVFAQSGFQFLANGAAIAIGTQIGGKASNIAPGNQVLELQAIRTSDSTGQCEAALQGVHQIEMAFECEDPASCTASQVNIDGGTPASIAGNAAGPIGSWTSVNLDFGNATDTTAAFVMNYPDVGQIQLHARYNIPLDDGSGTPSSIYMNGASSSFVVRPFGFNVVATGNPGATGPAGGAFTQAGADFTVTATAVLYQAGDDTDNNGIPDNHDDSDPSNNADLSDNTAALNYGQEAVTENVALTGLLDQPGGGNDPGLAGNTTISSFTNGAGNTATARFDEVGIIEIAANISDNDYLGEGPVESKSGYVGRFIPNNFVMVNPVLSNRSDIVACPDVFTYMGENFQIAYDLQAHNARSPSAVTQNYIGAFAKLDPTSLADLNYGATEAGTDLTARLTVGSAGAFAAGVASITATLQFDRNATPDGAYNPVEFGIAPADSDGVALLPAALDLSLDGGPDTHAKLDETDIRYGRLNIQNNFGSELQPLVIPLLTEYYLDATAEFVTNSDDSCTSITTADVLLYNDQEPKTGRALGNTTINIGGAGSTTLTGISAFSAGLADMNFSAAGAEGYVDIEVQTPSYLLSDLDAIDHGVQGPGQHCNPALNGSGDPAEIGGCTADANLIDDIPLGRASFGIFRGSDNIIYIREVVP